MRFIRFLLPSSASKKASLRITDALHRQIREAAGHSDDNALPRVASFFTLGYFYGFVRTGFDNMGLDGEPLTEKYFRPICKGIPGNFYKVIRETGKAYQDALQQHDDSSEALYRQGLAAGIADADVFRPASTAQATRLSQFLIEGATGDATSS